MARAGEAAKNLRRIAENIVENVNIAKINAAGEGIDVAIYATRVDTEHARSNWQGTVGSPAKGVLGKREYGANRGGAAALSQSRSAMSSAQPGQPVYITNNVPYIVALDLGSPTNSADQMTSRAVFFIQEYLRGVRVIQPGGGRITVNSRSGSS